MTRRRGARLATLLLLGAGSCAGVGISSGQAAFEIRPTADFPPAVLPAHLPGALASMSACLPADGAGWSATALHLPLEVESPLGLDAAGVRIDRPRWSGRACVTRLGLPSYSEWNIDLTIVAIADLAVQTSYFRTQPSEFLRRSAGLEPRAATTLGMSRSWAMGRGTLFRVWLRDGAGTGERRRLGVVPGVGGGVEIVPGIGWTASMMCEWGGGRGRPETHLAITWRPFAGWGVEHTRASTGGAESTALGVARGNLEVLAWTARLAEGMPSLPGLVVSCRGPAIDAAPATTAPAVNKSRPDGIPRPRKTAAAVPASSPPEQEEEAETRPEFWSEWEREPGEERLIVDGVPVLIGLAEDSLGAGVDSLAEHITEPESLDGDSDASVHPPSRGPGEMDKGATESRWRMAAWSALRDEDVPLVNGADPEARRRFLAAVRTVGPRALAAAVRIGPDSLSRRLLLATAPYASSNRPAPRFALFPWNARAGLRWYREIRSSGGKKARSTDRWEFHPSLNAAGIHLAARRKAGRSLQSSSWTALWEGNGSRVVTGRGNAPLTWGSGLWLRSRTMEVRSAAPSGGASALSPTASGDQRFVAGEIRLGSGGSRLVAMGLPGTTWVAGEWRSLTGSAGLIAGLGGGRTRLGLLVTKNGPGGAHQAELGLESHGPVLVALHTAGATARPGGVRAWWSVEARTRLAAAWNPGGAPSTDLPSSPERRVRLRGSLNTASLQLGGTCEVSESGIDTEHRALQRCGNSLQLRAAWRAGARSTLSARATHNQGRTIRETDLGPSDRRTRRLGVRATAERGPAGSGRGAERSWLVDAGYERRETRSRSAAEEISKAPVGRWLGLALKIHVSPAREFALGVLDVRVPAGGALQVIPGWSASTGFSPARGGLWGAGGLRWTVARLRVEMRASWPLLLTRGTRAAHATWVLGCGT